MIQKKIICDRCKKIVFNSEDEKPSDIIESMLSYGSDGELGYVEINIIRFDGKCTKTLHFCEDCYDVAVKAWNESK